MHSAKAASIASAGGSRQCQKTKKHFLTHKDFLNPLSNIDKDEFSIEYNLPKIGTTIKVRLHITGDNESPEKIKIGNSLRFNTIELG